MLTFKLVNGLKGKILFDQQSRLDFDRLRNQFKVQNDAARFARQYSYSVNPYKYCISILGVYQIRINTSIMC